MKKVISVFLAILMVVTMFPLTVFAENGDGYTTETQQEISYSATNAVGNMILDAADTELKSNNAGYSIQSVEINGTTAKSEILNTAACTLVVAIFDDDGKMMLGSGKTELEAKEYESYSVVETKIIIDEMPEYFYVKAFLLDADNNPLCKQYETRVYTRDFETFMSKTTADFEEEYVINLDESEEENFIVVSDDAILIESYSDKNIVATNDYVDGNYVIENADEQIMNLNVGDVFYYQYGDDGEYILAKVGKIDVSGDTVTIEATKPDDITEIFQFAKVDITESESTVETEESDVYSRVNMMKAVNIDFTTSKKHAIDIGVGVVSGALEITASLNFKLYVYDDYFEIGTVFSSEETLTINISGEVLDLTFSPAMLGFDMSKLGLAANIKIAIVVRAGYAMKLVIKFYDHKIGFAFCSDVGIINKSKSPEAEISDPELASEMEAFIGVALQPELKGMEFLDIVLEANAGLKLNIKLPLIEDSDERVHDCTVCFGIEVFPSTGVYAEIKMDIPVVSKLIGTVNINETLVEYTFKLGDFYLSAEQGFGAGICPGYRYKVAVIVKDTEGKALSDISVNDKYTTNSEGQVALYLKSGKHTITAVSPDGMTASKNITVTDSAKTVELEIFRCKVTVTVKDGEGNAISGATVNGKYTTDANGVVEFYLLEGVHTITATYDGDTAEKDVTISTETNKDVDITISKCRVIVTVTDTDGNPLSGVAINGEFYTDENGVAEFYLNNGEYVITVTSADGLVEKKDFVIDGEDEISISVVMRQNKCGDDLTWELTEDDELIISGTGPMYNYSQPHYYTGGAPWGERPKKITIKDGVTSIGNYAFYRCMSATEVSIPDGVIRIGDNAFRQCSKLKNIQLPDSVTSIIHSAFNGCNRLESINIPDGCTYIGEYALAYCENLKSIELSEDTTYIGSAAFSGCSGITDFSIPEKVERIEEHTFSYCSNLKNINIPDGVKSIGANAFLYCYSLKNISIPDSVTYIAEYAFNNSGLTEIKIPDSVTEIGTKGFVGCHNLTNVVLSQNMTEISFGLFEDCYSLKSVTVPISVKKINVRAFNNCRSLEKIYYFGTKEQFDLIENHSEDTALLNAEIIYNYTPTEVSYLSSHTVVFSEDGLNYVISDAETGNDYVMLVVKDENAEDLLSSDNLLYIDQKTAEETELTFSFYLDESVTDYKILHFNENLSEAVEPDVSYILGDANGDGEITASDARIALRIC